MTINFGYKHIILDIDIDLYTKSMKKVKLLLLHYNIHQQLLHPKLS